LLTVLRNGDYVNGITIWSQSVARYPDNPRAHINLGNAYVNAEQPRLGAEEFEAALKLDPDLAEAHNNLGVVEAGLGEKDKAEAEYRAAMKLSPGWPKPRENLEALDPSPIQKP
jgi:Flp pilus assembly protein TadD